MGHRVKQSGRFTNIFSLFMPILSHFILTLMVLSLERITLYCVRTPDLQQFDVPNASRDHIYKYSNEDMNHVTLGKERDAALVQTISNTCI